MEKEHFNLKENFNPSEIKNLSLEDLNILSADIRKQIIEICSENGGHLSSNLGVVELTVALHHFFNLPKDKVIFDVGHQSYSHKILSGRNLESLRKNGGISGFQKRDESEYDSYEAGHSSTSISAAMGMALSRDLNGEDYNIIAVIGDSSIANGVAIEALNNLASFNHKIIIIINDNNRSIANSYGMIHNLLEKLRLSKHYLNAKNRYRKILTKYKITKPLYSFTSSVKNFFKYHLFHANIFRSLGFYYIASIDGHDIKSLESAFKSAINAPTSVVIHVTTTKGKGYKYAENDEYGEWHGIGPFNIVDGTSKNKTAENMASWSEIYASLLLKKMDEDNKAVLINPATTVGSKLEPIFKKYPDRCFDVGISEEHAAIFAAGIAAQGNHPYLSIYSTFMQRSYDEISHDIARLDVPVTILVDRAGLVGEDGETHQGIYDMAFLYSIPSIAIAMAKDNVEAERLFAFSSTYNHPLVIRYPRDNTMITNNPISKKPIQFGTWINEQKGNKGAIISYGPVIENLKKYCSNYTIVNAIFQRPINQKALEGLLEYKHIIIYDIYGTEEGFASAVLRKLNDLNYQGKVHILALPNIFVKQGTIEEQLKDLNRDIKSLRDYLKENI